MFSPWRLAAGLSILALGALWLMPASAAQLVRIGAAHFPPYTVRPEQGADTGLLPQLVEALNALQTDYQFVLVPTSIPRRFRDFEQGRVDMAIFENPKWGWQDIPHVDVDMGLEDAEIFVAQREPGRDQSYFADLAGKRLAVFSGYHYAFAHFNPDPKYLAEHFNATLTYSHDSNLLMVARGRADIALVTRSYLSDFLARNADTAGQFLVSERIDQVYHHYALLRPKAPITGPVFAGLLKQLRDNGLLLKIFEPYRIDVMPVP
ncbi:MULTISPECIES: ABC transporter substrate-binding protein [unclassified Pseudomonas]|uniref:substrate-binding periplasmic protein n=1 Tax=unclassified Pseudomonas TaxID=196821 RepID=UPI00159FFBB1|nr:MULTISPECIES: PhnD/SsuA/transferrin family substrate-binding protein [unclassified Pseudomonas]NWC95981.1 amino acid ABC transporter substrate-binding protein [Pseudomonas sp. IPO3779]NWD20173.1 amino acid ABC transporter substrate-binding protein [Pseudomonas sp. IPO3778]